MARCFDSVVVGGGLVGLAIARGLTREGLRVAVCDEGDRALRASRGNFGLVWVQGKGADSPAYARLTARSAQCWPAFAERLRGESGIDPALAQPGGFDPCLRPDELDAKAALMARLQAHTPEFRYDVLDARAVRRHFPDIAPDIAGAIHSPRDGHVNPLKTLYALCAAFQARGGVYLPRHRVTDIAPGNAAFTLTTAAGALECARLVLAAGLGNAPLAPLVGLRAPVTPVRGQLMITERLPPFLPYPTPMIRQTDEGAVQIGESREPAAGFDDGTLPGVLAGMARRAIRLFPRLRQARIVRAWGALRVMTPDGLPLYEESRRHPGAFIASCHSGVTLAAAHCEIVAPWIAGTADPGFMENFHAQRRALQTPAD
ncbi:MAG: FAD-binding oxidoreductase [Candidatus Accumulibacter sp.]|jgi:glycine/D-amino acid oxidase-like deaminating enzyme|nr:FAD-binding oxidoreductase [Accumulibacter sp.]